MSRAAFMVSKVAPAALRALNYSPYVERIRAAPKRRSVLLSSLIEELGPAYGTVFTRLDCAPEHGVELLSQADMFAAEPRGRIIRRDSMPRPDRHEVKPLQVLIAGAGTLGENELYGRSILADARLVGKHVGPDAMVITFREPESAFSLFAYAFLASAAGVAAIRSTSYGTKLLRFREDLFGSLPIPRADEETVERVAALVRRAVEQRGIYARELQIARSIFEGLPEMNEARKELSNRRIKFVLWDEALPTMRAWNYVSAGDALRYLRKEWSERLRDRLTPNGLFKGGRMSRIPCKSPHGVDLLSQRDTFSIRPIPRRVRSPATEELSVSNDMIVMASRGQMSDGAIFGQVELGAHMPKGTILTEDITRLIPKEGVGEALYAFLSTEIGQALLRTTAYGTSIPGMRMDLLLELPVPNLAERWLTKVTATIRRSTTARVSAATAEVEAIRIIEEEVLPAWLV
jgi:hypothetical protein